jgi:hypothetical protein
MPNIDNVTLLAPLQSVYESINRFERLLESETLSDPENITELLMSYDEALESGANLPPLESILYGDKTE